MSHRPDYPSDLTDEEWQIIEPLVPPVESGGRPAEHGRREIVNATFYVLRTGCQWRFLPHDFPSWKTVYTQYCSLNDICVIFCFGAHASRTEVSHIRYRGVNR